MALLKDEEIIEMDMLSKRADFMGTAALNIFTATWNTGNFTPFDPNVYPDLVKWLFAANVDSHPFGSKVSVDSLGDSAEGKQLLNNDLIVICLQEIVNLENPYNLIGDFTTYRYYIGWAEVLCSAINEYHRTVGGKQYALLTGTNLVGMAIYAFAPVPRGT